MSEYIVKTGFDHSRWARLPEYHALRKALSDLINAAGKIEPGITFADITDMARTSYAGDFCPCCRDDDKVPYDDKTCWPFVVEIEKPTNMRATHRCPRTARTWYCWWGTDPSMFP